MKAIKKKWHKLSLFQQILVSFVVVWFILIFGPFILPILLPIAAFLLVFVTPILVAWCVLRLIMGREKK